MRGGWGSERNSAWIMPRCGVCFCAALRLATVNLRSRGQRVVLRPPSSIIKMLSNNQLFLFSLFYIRSLDSTI